MKSQSIALCMIVKNESHIICETLESVSKYISYYAINDTGSTDNTRELIKEFFDKKGIPGVVVDHEFRTCKCHGTEYKKYSFFHFGWNRSYALNLCSGKSDYIWVIDADDLVVGNLVFPELTKDCYSLTYGKDFTYQRIQLFKNEKKFNWYYNDALHEYPDSIIKNYTKGHINGEYHMVSRRLGARNNDAQKYYKDAQVFNELLKTDKDNSRYVFYCAQSYFDYHDYVNAKLFYERRTTMKGFQEEVFYSHYRIGQCMEHLNMAWADIEKAYLDAHVASLKKRAEPLYVIANHYRKTGDYIQAYKYIKQADTYPYPEECILFIYKCIYEYNIKEELSAIAAFLGKYNEAISVVKTLLSQNVVPKDHIDPLKKNLDNWSEKLALQEKKLCCIYLGNEYLNTIIVKFIEIVLKTHKVIIIGDKIDPYLFQECLIITCSEFKPYSKIKIDYLILWDSVMYYYDNMELNATHIVLFQCNEYIKVRLTNGMVIFIQNHLYLNSIFKKIEKIVCANPNIAISLVDKYKLPFEILPFINHIKENNLSALFDEIKHEYVFTFTPEILESNRLENRRMLSEPLVPQHPEILESMGPNEESNGIRYMFPDSFETVRNNKHAYDFCDKHCIGYYEEIIKQLPQIPETYYLAAKFLIGIKEYSAAMEKLNSCLKLIKTGAYRETVLLAKAEIFFGLKQYIDSYEIADEVLRRNLITDTMRINAEDIRDRNISEIQESYTFYPKNKIKIITKNLNGKTNRRIVLSITSCKQINLFEKTISSFINCCLDLDQIDHWLCVNNSFTQTDLTKIKKMFPFIEFIEFINSTQSVYSHSINLIREYAVKHNTTYLLYLEDDWQFIQKRRYVSDSLKIFNEDPKFGQVLFNRNMAKIEPNKRRYYSGQPKLTQDGMRYCIHEYDIHIKQYANKETRVSWPHFSLKPSLIRVASLGLFPNTLCFERDFADEYVANGYQTATFDSFCCVHIGHQLSLMREFVESPFSINVLSDDIAQWVAFKESSHEKLPLYTRHPLTNITTINDYYKPLFLDNNFHYLRSYINPIVQHIDLFRENKAMHMMVLTDAIKFQTNFVKYYGQLQSLLLKTNYDIVLLDQIDESSESHDIQLIKKSIPFCLETLHGYIISSAGIKKILDFVQQNGIKDVNYLHNISDFTTYVINKPLYLFTKTMRLAPTIPVLSGYKFYSQMDSYGGDLGWYGIKTTEEYAAICDKAEGICFNTLGYIKNSISLEKDFIYLPETTKPEDGLWVNIGSNESSRC